VRGMLLAGALAASVAVAMPARAQAPGSNANPQATAPVGTPEQPAGAEQLGAEQPSTMWMQGGGWAMRGGPMMMMHRGMMHRMMMMRGDPQQRCINRLAWRAARRAYVETELNLTSEQRPLWDKLQGIAQSEQQKERQLCNQLKSPEKMTTLDRLDRAQAFLSARLDALNAAKPAVQALYQSLTPEQRQIFDHPFRRD
jgi:hypothetical protein